MRTRTYVQGVQKKKEVSVKTSVIGSVIVRFRVNGDL